MVCFNKISTKESKPTWLQLFMIAILYTGEIIILRIIEISIQEKQFEVQIKGYIEKQPEVHTPGYVEISINQRKQANMTSIVYDSYTCEMWNYNSLGSIEISIQENYWNFNK